MRFQESKRERVIARGFCLGPLDGLPPIGSVGADLKADCTKCGKRVRVTVRGKFANHRPFDRTPTIPPSRDAPSKENP